MPCLRPDGVPRAPVACAAGARVRDAFAPAARLLGVAALGAGALGCEAPGTPSPLLLPRVEADAPTLRYEAGSATTTLFFGTRLHNRSDSALVVYAFAYAADEAATPPPRALYPPRALASMPADRRFAMGRHDLGQRLALAPGASVPFEGVLPLPKTHATGQRIAARGFAELTLYVYAENGRLLLRRAGPVPPR